MTLSSVSDNACKVLVVSSLASTRVHLAMALRTQGELLFAANGMEAQHFMLAEPVDRVLCDAVLEDMSAADLCMWIRLIPAAPYVYFLAVYKETHQGEAFDAMAAGADGSFALGRAVAELEAVMQAAQRVLHRHRRIDAMHLGGSEQRPLAMLERRSEGSGLKDIRALLGGEPAQAPAATPRSEGGLQDLRAPQGSEPAQAPAATPRRKSLKLLAVDDEPLYPDLVKLVAEAKGHSCDVAFDGRSAFRLASSKLYDVVVSDWMMPHLIGPELCRKLRSLPGPQPYFVLLTTLHATQNYQEAVQAGVDNYLNKPFDADKLELVLLAAARAAG